MGRIVYERRSRGIGQSEMKEEIRRFAEYLEAEKHASENTRVSYQRDLMQMAAFLEGMGIRELSRVTRTALNSYVLMLEKEGKAASTVSRNLASMKAFFGYEFKRGRIRKDPSESHPCAQDRKKGSGDPDRGGGGPPAGPAVGGFCPRRSGIRPCWSSFTPPGSAYRS